MFQGSRYDIGHQMGVAFRQHILASCLDARNHPPPMSAPACSEHILIALNLTQQVIPQVFTELQGIAAGAGVSLPDLMLSLYEDIWDKEDFETGCTDIAATRQGTITGQAIIGHNNDGAPDSPPPYIIRIVPDDGPTMTGVTLGGVGFSVGCNEYGLVVSGNQLSARDVKPGIPRIILTRAAMDQPTLHAALNVLLHPMRASSYNNVLGDTSGRVVSVEGSGKRAKVIAPTAQGILTHTNHYQHPEMVPLDGKGDMRSTTLREQQACTLMSERAGTHTVQTFQQVLRDHHGYPASICRHSHDATTGFSAVWEVEQRVFWYAEGHPCQAEYLPVKW